MTDGASSRTAEVFDDSTIASFLSYLSQHPNNRRVSPAERTLIIEWLTGASRKPASQTEFSRRNYVQKTFVWDAKTQDLLARGKNDGDYRVVVTHESIAHVVEMTHKQNNHLGWDATWRDVNASYYGILRSDVIFLLKRCLVCVHNPSKRAKNPKNEEFLNFKDKEIGSDIPQSM